MLSDCYGLLAAGEHRSPKETSEKARTAAARALKIDDTLAEAHVRLAASKLYDEWDWTGAEREYQQAIALNPTNATAHQRYSTYLIAMGRTEESLVEMRRALELDPVSLIINTGLGWHLYFARRYDQAIEQYRKTLELDPNFSVAYLTLGEAYVQKARYQEAFAAFDKAMAAHKGRAIAVLGHALATAGHRDKARQVLSQLKELAKQTYICPYNFAVVHAGLGDKDRALLWLERAYEERSIRLVFLQRDPVFDSLRSDLRFQQLLHRLGFVDRSLKLK
jgi:tetratricopeptide (TPR) repeat protein